VRHAHLLGPDDVPVQAEIRLVDGVIRCEKRGSESAALALQFEVREADGLSHEGGRLTLQTCLLPERKSGDRPYLLSLELARHRLMLFLNKLEDWALFDLPADHPVMQRFERARAAFTDAVVNQSVVEADDAHSAEADAAARKALALAVEASEDLALEQAERQLKRRLSGELVAAARAMAAPANALTDHEARESRNALMGTTGVILSTPPTVGVTIAPDQFSPALQQTVAESCDFITVPLRWMDMEPGEGKYAFGATDRWIEWAVRTAKLPVIGGPIIDFRPERVPEWLYIWENDYETLRELVYEHVRQIVTRYRRTIGMWTVVSGLHVNRNFTLAFEQIMDLTRLCLTVVRKLQPQAKVQIELDQPWGEFVTTGTRSIPPTLYAEMIGQAGLSVDQFALRVDMGQPEPGASTRDLMAFSELLDRYAKLEVPLSISALSAPAQPPEPESLGLGGQMDPESWRGAWSPETQMRWMTEMIAIAASKPFVHSVCWNELYDSARPSQQRHTGLLDDRGHPRPALARLAEIRRALRQKRSVLESEPAAREAVRG
jgi:hypothetical protein